MTIQNFVKKRPYLIWYVNNLEKVSKEAIVEAVLNYGDFNDVKEAIRILGIREIAKIFRKKSRQKRNNLRPAIKNYFTLYFKKYAQGNFNKTAN